MVLYKLRSLKRHQNLERMMMSENSTNDMSFYMEVYKRGRSWIKQFTLWCSVSYLLIFQKSDATKSQGSISVFFLFSFYIDSLCIFSASKRKYQILKRAVCIMISDLEPECFFSCKYSGSDYLPMSRTFDMKLLLTLYIWQVHLAGSNWARSRIRIYLIDFDEAFVTKIANK